MKLEQDFLEFNTKYVILSKNQVAEFQITGINIQITQDITIGTPNRRLKVTYDGYIDGQSEKTVEPGRVFKTKEELLASL